MSAHDAFVASCVLAFACLVVGRNRRLAAVLFFAAVTCLVLGGLLVVAS